MQRKATKKSTRAQNADEKRFMAWVKNQPCFECNAYGVMVDHMYGSAFIHNKVLIGHWALLPLCIDCDQVKTQGSANAYLTRFGRTQAQAWALLAADYDPEASLIPTDVFRAITDWNK